MQMNTYVQAVVEDLARVAAVGDEDTARAAELLAIALEASIARRLQEALAEAALELSAQLEQGHVEVRIAAEDPELVYVEEPGRAAEPADQDLSTLSARITLRLPEGLKSRIEMAAASAGISVNTWLVQTLSRSLEPRSSLGGPSRYRLTGYGRS